MTNHLWPETVGDVREVGKDNQVRIGQETVGASLAQGQLACQHQRFPVHLDHGELRKPLC